ncbi:MAG: polysaccharide biosynthesis tyrosine autokinase [Paludibacter sp.]|nr:polysaccharide biosynthesis tyrosine autokinase [Paludibacter sp.]
METNNNIKKTNTAKQIPVFDLREIFNVILKHWYWFVISMFVCAIIAILYVKSTPYVYKIETGILLRQNDKFNGSIDEVAMLQAIGFNSASKEVLDEIEILTSKTMTATMIDSLGIQNEYYVRQSWQWTELYHTTPFILMSSTPDFNKNIEGKIVFNIKKSDGKFKIEIASPQNKQTVTIENISDTFQTFAGDFHLVLTGNTFDKNAKYRIIANKTNELVDALNKKIVVMQTNKRSNAIKISQESACKEKGVDELNTLVALYNADAIADKNLIALNTKNFIDGRIKLIENDLFNVEHYQEQYKRANELTDLSTDARLYLQLGSDYERSRVALQSQLSMVNYMEDFVKDESNQYSLLPTGIVIDPQKPKQTNINNNSDFQSNTHDALIPAGTGINDATLNLMIKNYNDIALERMKLVRSTNENNPAVISKNQELQALKNNILASIASTKKGVEISLNDVISKDNLFKSKIKNVPTQERQYREIERQQRIKETLYMFLLEKQEEMVLSLASTTPSAKTLDKAAPSAVPIAPRRIVILFVALIIGALIPILILYIQNLLNNKLTGKDELKKALDIPLLGTIANTEKTENVVVCANVISPIAEQFRLVRTNLQFIFMGKPTPNVILVTSSISGEGKSFCAINLAMSLALTKKKTILLGMDIRNPKLNEYLEIGQKVVGISTFLSDETCKLDDITYCPKATPELHVIPCGTVPPNPAELLMSERTTELFEKLKQQYDYIIVDSAPVEIVSDTFILNKNIDITVYVVRSKCTPKDMLGNIRELYENKKLNNMALLLNGGTDADSHNYGKYYKTHKK